jgi:hypothetical protein
VQKDKKENTRSSPSAGTGAPCLTANPGSKIVVFNLFRTTKKEFFL